jgi:predicted Zn-dependent peptidase
MTDIKMTTLPNGLRVITDTVPSVGSVALGIWAHVGTRNEDMQYNGVAHMVEHMMFKGTSKRSAQEIVEVIENVGGNMNAYTSREITSYHMHLLKEDMPLALDVLADMFLNSTMPDDEIERERHVILQEIGMVHDTPDDLVFDNYYEAAYPAQAMGAPILGRADIIQSMRRDVMMDYVQTHYTPAHCVISAAGAINHEDFVSRVAQAFGAMPSDKPRQAKPADYKGGEFRTDKDLEQSHIVLGFQGPSRLENDYYAAQVLATLLGGGMSSRLFQEVREKRGLVYSIFSYNSSYLDDGQFGIYAGTGPKDIPELIPVVAQEIAKVQQSVTAPEIERAKAQLRAGALMGRESMMTRADQQAKFLLFRNKVLCPDQMIANINAVDEGAILSTAKRIFSSRPTLSALGPLKTLESFDTLAARLAA